MAKEKLEKIHNKLATNLGYFSANVLKIKDKSGNIVPFNFNREQRYVDEIMTKQMAERGYIRALLMKGRQQGMSSYYTARHYHSAMFNPGTSVFILTHKDQATKELYKKIQLFKRNSPQGCKPQLITDNTEGMQFVNESSYSLGTAGGKAVGRSLTVQKFHGSEVAFYDNEDDIITGVIQTIGLGVPGTEIVFESTANGPGGMFYEYAIDIMEGRDDEFTLIFVPWFWNEGYIVPLKPGEKFEHDEEEYKLKERYNLTVPQLNWRRKKLIELKHEWKFKQEYPCNPIEAFQHSVESLINSGFVDDARKSEVEDPSAPVILGYDGKGTGKDTACILLRRGRKVEFYKEYDELSPTVAASKLASMIEKYSVDRLFLDMAYGYGTYDILRQGGYRGVVVPVHFNETPIDPDRFMNKRAEMYYTMKEWFEDPPVSIPDDNRIHSEIMSIPEEKTTSNGKIYIISKDQIKKELKRSPGIADALALTFSHPVRRKRIEIYSASGVRKNKAAQKKALTTLRRHTKIKESPDKNLTIFDF